MKLLKTINGHQAVSMIPFDDKRKMRISTVKGVGGDLCTNATVVTMTDSGFTYQMFYDYSALMEREKVRVTTKAVKDQHERALAKLEMYIESARTFYINKA